MKVTNCTASVNLLCLTNVLLLEAEPDIVDDDSQGVVKTVDDVVPGQPCQTAITMKLTR